MSFQLGGGGRDALKGMGIKSDVTLILTSYSVPDQLTFAGPQELSQYFIRTFQQCIQPIRF